MRRTVLLTCAALVACSSGDDEPDGPAIVSFTAEALLVEPGAKTNLTWNVVRTAKVRIAPQGAPDLVSDSPKPEGTVETDSIDDHTVFTLRAEGVNGETVGASVLVRVNFPPPTIDEFSASPDSIFEGERTLLRWATTDAQSVTITDASGATIVEDGPPSDTLPIEPSGSTVYTLVATGNGGEVTATTEVTVVDLPPEIIEYVAQPEAIFPGEMTTLRWQVLNADTIRITSDSGETVYNGSDDTGAQAVSTSVVTDYRLDAINGSGTKTATVTVFINEPRPPKIDLFDAMPNPAGIGNRATISWGVNGARRLVVSRGLTAVYTDETGTAADSVDVTVTSTQARYTIFLENEFGTATETLELYGHAAPVIQSFRGFPDRFLGAQQNVDLAWDVQNVASLTLTANGVPVAGFPAISRTIDTVDDMGAFSTTATITTAYELFAESAGGMQRGLFTVVRGIAEIEPNDTSTTSQVVAAPIDVAGELATPTDVDVYAIDVPAGGAIWAETNNGPGVCEVNTQLALFGPDGVTPLVFDDDDGPGDCSRIDPDTDALAAGLPAGRYFLAVDSGGAGSGSYVLQIDLRGPSCGDGSVETGEQCDDGNNVPGDGCDAVCQFEVTPPIATVPGRVIPLNITGPNAIAVVAVELDRPGQSIAARATEQPGDACDVIDTAIELYDANITLLGAKSDGGPSGMAGDCASIRYPNDAFATNLAAGRHWLVVRSENGATGATVATITVRNPSCGNNVLETRDMEQCDDGNTMSGDGCSDTCQLEGGLVPEAEPNDSQSAANVSGLSGAGLINVQGTINPAGDDDVYSFVVPPAQTLRFSARTYSTVGQPMSCNSMTSDTRIFLEQAGVEATGPGTGELAYNDDIDNANNIWCSALTNIPLTSGTYYVRVQGWLDMQVADYFMELRLEP